MPATPTPWFVHDFSGLAESPSPGDVTISCDHPATITVASMGRALTGTLYEAQDNADLIVRAVNLHHRLIAALRSARELLDASIDRNNQASIAVLRECNDLLTDDLRSTILPAG